jgi:hypothetical protein
MTRVMLLVVVAFSTLTGAQEVKFVDLSAVPQRVELRYPPAKPSGGGVGGVGVGDGAPDTKDPHWLGVSLDRVAPTDITL